MSGVRRHTVCWLIRHGQTAWNREQRFCSRTDVPLTYLGSGRASAAGRRLRRQPLTVIVHNGLRQAEETAALIVDERAQRPQIESEPDWREADYGAWEGQTYHDVTRQHPVEARARFANPWRIAPAEGETLSAAQCRARVAWQQLLRRHDGGRIAVVTAATPIQLVLCDLLGIDPAGYWRLRIDLGSLSCIDLYPTAAIVRTVNEVPRLQRQAR